MLTAAIVGITAALVTYSVGVWAERRDGRLRWAHVGLFGAGLAFDATGTALMSLLAGGADAGRPAGVAVGLNGVMAVTGAVAPGLCHDGRLPRRRAVLRPRGHASGAVARIPLR